MKPYFEDATVTIHHGDCLDVLRELPDCSVDSVVTDPPYGLEFMGKAWDRFDEDSKARAGMSKTGYTDGAERLERPSFLGGLNPKCRTCQKWQRGGNPCTCERPDFPDERRARSAAFGDWCQQWTAECLRVLKPGGHLLAFGGTRTWHRLACAVEDAGFEVRDSIAWMYGSGFPKSLDVSKAIDKRRDWSLVERLSGEIRRARADAGLSLADIGQATLAATDGTYGKWYHRGGHMFFETGRSLPSRPEWDQLRHVLPIAPEFAEVYDEAEREVLSERVTVVEGGNGGWSDMVASGRFRPGEKVIRETAPATPDAERWQGWGTALKPAFEPIVVARKPLVGTVAANVLAHGTGALNVDGCRVGTTDAIQGSSRQHNIRSGRYAAESESPPSVPDGFTQNPSGRWPANVILDGQTANVLDEQSGVLTSGRLDRAGIKAENGIYGAAPTERSGVYEADAGGASRFFYVAKADASERVRVDGIAHPTVKPIALMRWLVRLVTPPGGTVLEPFAGSGTTVEACILEGFRCVAIEREADYLPLIKQRIHRRRDPVEAVRGTGEDMGLFADLDFGGPA